MQLESEKLWNQYYKETIHRIEDIVLWYNSKGVLINWNSAAVQNLGYEGRELGKLSIHSFFASELPFLKEEAPYFKEWSDIPVYRKNRTCFVSSIKVLTIRDTQVYGICIIESIQQIKDLQTQVAALAKELEQANEVKNLFLANVTHELRTPLNGMMGILSMMDNTVFSEQTKEDYELLKACCQNMEKIVNQILDYTKMMAGKLESYKETFVVQEWLAPIIRINQSLAQHKGLSFEISLEQTLPQVLYGDKEWIGQVLNNLLGNAIKFTEQGSVRLEIVKKAETVSQLTVLFVVSDTGIGIKEEQIKYLFQSFSQAEASITRKFGGTGLGLAISKGFVEAMGGTLEVESKYLKGSRFYFELVLDKVDSVQSFEKLNNQYHITETQGKNNNKGQQVEFTLSGGSRVNEQELYYLISQILLCIEFGSWERAQVYSHQIKTLLQGQNSELGKWAFRLELASRRKDSEKAKELLEGLKVALDSN